MHIISDINDKGQKRFRICKYMILVIQVGVMIFLCSIKPAINEDEIWTFFISNRFVVKPDIKSVGILVEYNDSSYCIPINKADYEYPLVCHVLRGLAMYGIVTKSSAISLSLQNGNAISKKATPSSLREKAIICKISDESSSANPSVLTIDIKKHSLSWGKNMLFTSTINNTILSLVGK